MFKLFFRSISIFLFVVFLTIGLSLWKGGEPFRWVGEGTQTIGKSIAEFGDFVDDVIAGGKDLEKNYNKLKDIITNGEDK